MKYWIFQNNQVLGPYEPDDLGKNGTFTAESLVCPEGRRGTSMGDWQRAGMVPDLSVALVRANTTGRPTAVGLLGDLPPEPTLRDLAALGTLQEKMTTLEDVVHQLQEGLRAKDAELAALHEELSLKEKETSAMKRESSATKEQAEDLRRENEARRREAEEFQRKIGDLEERLTAVGRLSETIDKAVEAEKHVEHDVESHGAALTDLSKEIEALKAEMQERIAQAAAAAAAAAVVPPPAPSPVAAAEWPAPAAPSPMPTLAPPTASAVAAPEVSLPGEPAPMPEIAAVVPAPAPETAPAAGMLPPTPLPMFGSPEAAPVPGFAAPEPAPEAAPAPDAGAALAETATPEAVPAGAPAPAAGGKKKALVFGGLAGLVALAAVAVLAPRFLKKPAKSAPPVPAGLSDTAPLPTPTPAAGTPGGPIEPMPPAAAPQADPRQEAIDAAKGFQLPDGRTLGQALETLSPPAGNLPPWMAEPLPNGRAVVNYFAHGAPGSPTVAYEFEVDPVAKAVVGRNAAAKTVLAGKAAPPPAPPKPKAVKVKAKKPAAKPAPAPKAEESLDSLLGEPGAVPEAKPAAAAPAVDAAAAAPTDDAPTAPGEEPAPAPKPTAAKRAAKAKPAPAKPAAKAPSKADDEALLDDLLKE